MDLKAKLEAVTKIKFLDCFLDDPLPSPKVGKYDYEGKAVWLVSNTTTQHHVLPHIGFYKRQVLPLYALSDKQLEELASDIITICGDPNADPVYSARHLYYDGKHNLFLYKIRRALDKVQRDNL